MVTAGQYIRAVNRAFVGDTQYSDIGLTASGQRGRTALETALGARVLSRGAGRGVYGEASAILSLNDRLALVISGGRYPTDPIRGSIAGRYASAALRLHIQPKRAIALGAPQLGTGADGEIASASPMLSARPDGSGRARLIVRAPNATLVEIAGDFTEWRPIALQRAPNGDWEIVQVVTSGVHRVNVRIDGGPWTVPAGTTRLAGDFGDYVGVFVVP